METITMKVKGMTCGGCVAAVERVLRELDGVGRVEVSLERGEASVAFDAAKVEKEDLRAAVEDAGYDVVA
jgi:copper chaperone